MESTDIAEIKLAISTQYYFNNYLSNITNLSFLLFLFPPKFYPLLSHLSTFFFLSIRLWFPSFGKTSFSIWNNFSAYMKDFWSWISLINKFHFISSRLHAWLESCLIYALHLLPDLFPHILFLRHEPPPPHPRTGEWKKILVWWFFFYLKVYVIHLAKNLVLIFFVYLIIHFSLIYKKNKISHYVMLMTRHTPWFLLLNFTYWNRLNAHNERWKRK